MSVFQFAKRVENFLGMQEAIRSTGLRGCQLVIFITLQHFCCLVRRGILAREFGKSTQFTLGFVMLLQAVCDSLEKKSKTKMNPKAVEMSATGEKAAPALLFDQGQKGKTEEK